MIDGFLYGFDTFLYLVGFDRGHMFNADGSYHRFDGHSAVSFQVQLLHVNAGVRLVPGHGGGTVVENNQGEIVVIVNRIDKPRDSRVEKC